MNSRSEHHVLQRILVVLCLLVSGLLSPVVPAQDFWHQPGDRPGAIRVGGQAGGQLAATPETGRSGLRGTVREINTRATIVNTNDSVDVVVPNSELVTTKPAPDAGLGLGRLRIFPTRRGEINLQDGGSAAPNIGGMKERTHKSYHHVITLHKLDR